MLMDNQVLPLVPGTDWNPPALNLAEIRVGHIDEQGQAGHPHAHLQLSTQETVGEVEHHLALASRLLSIRIHVIASL